MYARKFINVGEIHIALKPTEIITVLGSCIAVCLYDNIEKISGMNHYLVPLWNGNGLQSPKYGNVSIPKLIEGMQHVGCQTSHIEAKIFGGANINITDHEHMMIGKKNILIAKEMLKEYKIPIVAEDAGGSMGRRIMMRSDTGKILMRYAKGDS